MAFPNVDSHNYVHANFRYYPVPLVSQGKKKKTLPLIIMAHNVLLAFRDGEAE